MEQSDKNEIMLELSHIRCLISDANKNIKEAETRCYNLVNDVNKLKGDGK